LESDSMLDSKKAQTKNKDKTQVIRRGFEKSFKNDAIEEME